MANHVCPWWLAFTFDNPLRKLIHHPRRILAGHVQAGMTVMDVGCGMGYFSIGMAKLVGADGRVICVDLQPQMLARVKKRADRERLSTIIQTRQCTAQRIDVHEPLDFILAFWMVHETPEPKYFLQQMRGPLKTRGKFLITEPKFHVGSHAFERELDMAQDVGFRIIGRPAIAMSHAALLSPI